MQRELGVEQGGHLSVELWIAEARYRFVGTKSCDLEPQPRQCLRKFHTDRAYANHGDAGPEGGLLKQRVSGQHTMTKNLPFFRHRGPRARGNHDAARIKALPINVYCCRSHQRGMARSACVAEVFGNLQRARYELVAQQPHTPEHGRDVCAQPCSAAQAQFIKNMSPVKRIRRFNQYFGWHAPHACASGAPRAFVDDEKSISALTHFS